MWREEAAAGASVTRSAPRIERHAWSDDSGPDESGQRCVVRWFVFRKVVSENQLLRGKLVSVCVCAGVSAPRIERHARSGPDARMCGAPVRF